MLTEKTVRGIHFVQEDSPDEIGQAIAGWMGRWADGDDAGPQWRGVVQLARRSRRLKRDKREVTWTKMPYIDTRTPGGRCSLTA
jgi:hypothetical protein